MKNKAKVLIVDDEQHNILLMEMHLRAMGHQTVGVRSGAEALATLDRSFDLVVADMIMPQMDGFELMQAVRAKPETEGLPIMVVSSLTERDDRLRALKFGANDYLIKPYDAVELGIRINALLSVKFQRDEIVRFETELAQLVEDRTSRLQAALNKVHQAHEETLMHLCAAAEYKDEETGAHVVRMSRYSGIIAEGLGLSDEHVERIVKSSPMHDIGKIGIPDAVLLKPGKLDAAEWEIIRKHPLIGADILKSGESEYTSMGRVISLTHHERWDGSGYPSGLAGMDIPIEGRISAVADVFDALTSRRPYKEPFSVDKAAAIMKEERGRHFDPDCLDVFFDRFDAVLDVKRTCLDEPECGVVM